VSIETAQRADARPSVSVLKLAGPGLVVAATGIGSGDVVSATVGGARYGVVLLWAIVAGAFFKFVLQEGIARWQLATGKTALEGWADHLPAWVKWYFVVYLVLWTVAVSASLTNATGLGIANLTGGAISQPWGAVAHSLIGFAFVFFGGYDTFEKFMKFLVGVMGFSILFCAIFTLEDPARAAQGVLIPSIPAGSGANVLSLIGGVGGSITMLSYNYWMREEGMRGSGFLSYVRGDIAIAYLFTAVFGMSIMLIANDAFFTWRGLAVPVDAKDRMPPVPCRRHPDVLNRARALDVREREHLFRLNPYGGRDLPAHPQVAPGLGAGSLRRHAAAPLLPGEILRADRTRLCAREAVQIAHPCGEAVERTRGGRLPRRISRNRDQARSAEQAE
jgi:hypothetical protein